MFFTPSLPQFSVSVPIRPVADSREVYAYDGQNMILQFQGSGGGTLAASAVKHFMLYGPAVDQILADDYSSSSGGSGSTVHWMLADNLGSVRDVVIGNSSSGGTVVDHLKYDAFGNITSQNNPAEQPRFTYTGRELDANTGLYYYRARWYDAKTGKFISQDPMSFKAGDENLYRYVGNGPTNATDPTGMWIRDTSVAGRWERFVSATEDWKKSMEKFRGCIIAERGDTFGGAMKLMTGKPNKYQFPDDWIKDSQPIANKSYSIGTILEAFNNDLRENVANAAKKFAAKYIKSGATSIMPNTHELIYREYIHYFFDKSLWGIFPPRVECGDAASLVETEGLLHTINEGDEYKLGAKTYGTSIGALWNSYSEQHINDRIRKGNRGAFVNQNSAASGDEKQENAVALGDGRYFALNSNPNTIWGSASELAAYLEKAAGGKGPVVWVEDNHLFWDVVKIEGQLWNKRGGH